MVRNTAEVELAAVVDQVPETRRWAIEELGLAAENCYGSLYEALKSTDCEAVRVITPPETHCAVVTEALESGKHVMVEKPLPSDL